MDTSPYAYEYTLRNMRNYTASSEAVGGAVTEASDEDACHQDIYAPLFYLFRLVMRFVCGERNWQAKHVLRSEQTAQENANRKHRRIETRVMNLHRVPSARRVDILFKLRPAYVRTPAQFVNWAAGLYLLGRTSMLAVSRWSSRSVREAFMALSGLINWNVSRPLVIMGGLSRMQLPPD